MIIANNKNSILTVTDNGHGKRTSLAEYRRTNRGGKGITNIKFKGKNGSGVVALKGVQGDEDVLLITQNGIIIRVNVDLMRELSRFSQGVKLINLDDDDKVIDIAICDRDSEDVSDIPVAAPVETAPEEEDAADAAEEEEDEVADDGDGTDEAIDEEDGEDGTDAVDDTDNEDDGAAG